MTSTSTKPWYSQGLRFSCTRCGNCCTGEPGDVWVDAKEIDELAETVGLTTERFEAMYVHRVGRRRVLLERENGDCVLFDRGVGCTAYEKRPRQCRSWPFWESNLDSEKSWQRTTRDCPGAGKGNLFTVEEIVEQAKLIKL